MSCLKCPICKSKMKKNGFTKSGTQRWRCPSCGSSTVRNNDTTSRYLKMFVKWLLGKLSQSELKMPSRTFRSKTQEFWKLWPIIPICDEVHHVIYMDGIWLTRRCVILIACTDKFIVGCHLARSENSKDWACLMSRIAAPDVLVCDGGGGIEKARRVCWPATCVQRCIFHAFCQVKRCTTTRPKTQAGVDLYAIAKSLLYVHTKDESIEWLVSFQKWCSTYDKFLKERGEDGHRFKHERLRKARKGLLDLCHSGTLFTYLDDELLEEGSIPATSNKIENINGQIRQMLLLHRGMSIDHRIKAVFWFSYMQSEAPISFAKMTKSFPDDAKIKEWRRLAAKAKGDETGAPARWGEGIVWAEFHHENPYPYSID